MKTWNIRQRSMTACVAMLLVAPAFAVQWQSRHGMTATEYQDEFDKWTVAPYNYHQTSVSGYEKDGQARYAAIWEERSGPGPITHPSMTKLQYESLNTTYTFQGYRPVFLSGFGLGNNAYYSAIWEYRPGADVESAVGLSYSAYESANALRVAQGYQLVYLATCNAGFFEYFSAIWRKGDPEAYEVRVRQTASEYQQRFNAFLSQGYQLIAVSAATVGGQSLFTGVWKRPGDGAAWYSSHNLSVGNYQGETSNGYYQGYRPVFTSAFNTGTGERFNVIFHHNGGLSPGYLQVLNDGIGDYMQSNNVPGLSVAISRRGQLVFAKGFGLADRSANERVHPQHRFRIASISKTITAAAVLRLRDNCGLNLDATVFGPNGILGNSFGTPPYSAREQAITVRQLLNHTTGWRSDGISEITTSNPGDAIDWNLNNSAEPVNPPGANYVYLNVDFATAGRVIQRHSGKSYEQFTKDEVLAPSCVTRMEIGGKTLAQRKPDEVVYYNGSGDPHYTVDPRRMDANGGWIATPIDLLLFLRRIDGTNVQADLLQADSIAAMRTPSMAPSGDPNKNANGNRYGLGLARNGWTGASPGWGHNGGMPGSLGRLYYRDDGWGFAVLCNTRPADDPNCTFLGGIIDNFISSVDANAWPSRDLFPCTIPPGNPPMGLVNSRRIYVNGSTTCIIPTGSKHCDVFGGPFPTVNWALGVSWAGDQLFIRSGSYPDSVLFNRCATIRSYDGTAVIGQ